MTVLFEDGVAAEIVVYVYKGVGLPFDGESGNAHRLAGGRQGRSRTPGSN